MLTTGIDPRHVQNYAILVRRASTNVEARGAHQTILQAGYGEDRFLCNLMVEMYGRCKLMDEAIHVFESIQCPNQFSFNIMLVAFSQNGYFHQAQQLFTWMSLHDVVSWNVMLAASIQHQGDVIRLYRRMKLQGYHSDTVTFVTVLGACSSLPFLREGQLVHSHIHDAGLQSEVAAGTALVNMYGKCCEVETARLVFEGMREKDLVSWTTMITAYSENEMLEKAWETFRRMPQRNVVSWTVMLTAFADTGHLLQAKFLFDRIPIRDVISWNSMLTAYVKTKDLDSAESLFKSISQKTIASWNAMLTGYAEKGESKKALELFRRMDHEGYQPDKISFISVVESLGSDPMSAADARVLHSEASEAGVLSEAAVATAFVDLYGRCGRLKDAEAMFWEMPHCSMVSWNAMLTAYARSGHTKMVSFLREMNNLGVTLTAVTFITVLASCSQRGLLKDGRGQFWGISADYGIAPILDHYICMVDLLGRSGQVGEAEELIEHMPFYADTASLTALVSAYKIHKTEEEQEDHTAAEKLCEVRPLDSGPYVLLSNVGRQRSLSSRLKQQS